jgi:uncharacterized protein YjiS (DUF1127 family)
VASFLPKLGHPQQVAFFLAACAGRRLIIEVCVMFLSVVLSGFRRWLRARETARQLNALSDRELSDIGIARHDIAQVARQGQ